MVALPQTYKPAEVEASTGGSSVPAGKYRCIVLGSEEKPNKDGKPGSHVQFEYQISEGAFKGQKIFERFNFNNPNEQAVNIAFSQFKQLAEACGKPDCADTDLLNNSVIVVTYGPQKNNPQYSEVKKREPGTSSLDGYVAPAATTTKSGGDTASAGSASGKPSWA